MKKILLSAAAVASTVLLMPSCMSMKMDFAFSGDYMKPMNVAENQISQEEISGDKFDEIIENKFISTAEEPVSTFSVDADGASYAIMRRYLTRGQLPNRNSVRIEEFLNYFTFNYPEPEGSDAVSFNYELAQCPWNSENMLLRLGMKGKSMKESELPTSNYVFLIDVSGSMDSDDKLPLLKNCLISLVDNLQQDDRVSIITYSGSANKILESTPVSNSRTIKKAIDKLNANGSTAGGAAIKMAYDEARQNFIDGGNNRIIMGTDGDFNVGISSTDSLVKLVEKEAAAGIYLTVCGFGSGNLNDGMMESISNHGNGTYEFIDCEKQMVKVFVNEVSKLYSVANDVKVQIRFNPAHVESYRLIGYENRVMANEDFNDDTKDAAEIGAGQTVTALYEIVPTEGADGSFATFDLRYKKNLGGSSVMLSQEIENVSTTPSEEFRFASGIAAFGMVLRKSEYRGSATFKMAREYTSGAQGQDPFGYRAEAVQLIDKAAELSVQQ